MRQPLKRFLKAILQGTFSGLYSAGFRLLGYRRARPVATWQPAAGPVLVVAPHPDDETAGCGGTILRHRAAGDPVTVLCATDGRRSRALGLPPAAMAAHRQTEAEDAANRLDVGLRWVGLQEGAWAPEALIAPLLATLSDLRPTLIYAPSRIDYHPEHAAVAAALATALEQAAAPAPALRIYPVHVPLTALLHNLLCPTSAVADAVRHAFAAYPSQGGTLERCLRMRRYAASLHSLRGEAEVFWNLSAAAYTRLHPAPTSTPQVAPYRGLRYYAWSDPLAYLRGRPARQRLLASL